MTNYDEIVFHNPLEGAKLVKYPGGSMTQTFGANPRVYYVMTTINEKNEKIHLQGHNGIDLWRPLGNHLLAAMDGVVCSINNNPMGYGKEIRILSKVKDFYIELCYGHASEILVKPGQEVTAGQKIGLIGNTGFVISTDAADIKTVQYWGNAPANKGVHLHFGPRKLIDAIPYTRQLTYLGKAYSIPEINNGFFGYFDPMPFFKLNNNVKNMRYVKDGNEQYLLDDTLKIALNIGDSSELAVLSAKGIGLPATIASAELAGYEIYPLVRKSRWAEKIKEIKDLTGF